MMMGSAMPKRSTSRPISDAAEREAEHGQRVGQRRVGTGDAELGLERRAAPPRTDHMPTPPMVLMSTARASRTQA